MKKLYALAFAAFICSFANAQVKKGDIVLGGNIAYFDQATSTNDPSASVGKFRTFSIVPSFGKAIKDNLVLGFDIAYDRNTQSYNPGYSTTNNGFGAGIFLRKYKPLGNGFYLFGQSSISGSYTHGTMDEPQGTVTGPLTNTSNSYNVKLQFFPGVAFAVTPKWQLEAGLPAFFSINWSHTKQTETFAGQPDINTTTHSFNAASSLTGSNTISVGIRYFIGS
jgi:hypothetical protein